MSSSFTTENFNTEKKLLSAKQAQKRKSTTITRTVRTLGRCRLHSRSALCTVHSCHLQLSSSGLSRLLCIHWIPHNTCIPSSSTLRYLHQDRLQANVMANTASPPDLESQSNVSGSRPLLPKSVERCTPLPHHAARFKNMMKPRYNT